MQPTQSFFIAGTDTEVGKTIVSLGLTLSLKADYWKPIQTGQPTDSEKIQKYIDHKDSIIHPPAYSFKEPLSPNQSAQKESKTILLKNIQAPQTKNPFLIVEGIGGVYVPLNDKESELDLIKQLHFPVILVARSGVGTLNHSLLTLEVLRSRSIPVLALVLSGKPHPYNKKDLLKWSNVPFIFEIPVLNPLNKTQILKNFEPITKLLKKV